MTAAECQRAYETKATCVWQTHKGGRVPAIITDIGPMYTTLLVAGQKIVITGNEALSDKLTLAANAKR